MGEVLVEAIDWSAWEFKEAAFGGVDEVDEVEDVVVVPSGMNVPLLSQVPERLVKVGW